MDIETNMGVMYDELNGHGAWDALHADKRNEWRAAFTHAAYRHAKSVIGDSILVPRIAGKRWRRTTSAAQLAAALVEYFRDSGLYEEERYDY